MAVVYGDRQSLKNRLVIFKSQRAFTSIKSTRLVLRCSPYAARMLPLTERRSGDPGFLTSCHFLAAVRTRHIVGAELVLLLCAAVLCSDGACPHYAPTTLRDSAGCLLL